jgi:hypothetical protein
MSRKQLFTELIRLEKEARIVREQIDAMDYSKRFAKAKKYEGKFYKGDGSNPSYVYVYDTCKRSCEPISLEFYYYDDEGKVSFSLNSRSSYFPSDMTIWEEITEGEFMSHYVKVKEALTKIIR